MRWGHSDVEQEYSLSDDEMKADEEAEYIWKSSCSQQNHHTHLSMSTRFVSWPYNMKLIHWYSESRKYSFDVLHLACYVTLWTNK